MIIIYENHLNEISQSQWEDSENFLRLLSINN
jgi:hypothetical protein